jgi:hypothetical protein
MTIKVNYILVQCSISLKGNPATSAIAEDFEKNGGKNFQNHSQQKQATSDGMAMLLSDDDDDIPFKQENNFESILNFYQPTIIEHENQRDTLPSYSLLRSSLPSPIEVLNNHYIEGFDSKEEKEEGSMYSEKGPKKRSRESIEENNNEYGTNGESMSITMECPSNKIQKMIHEIHYEMFNDKIEETALLDVEDDDLMSIESLPSLPPLPTISSGLSSDQAIYEVSPINVENGMTTTDIQDYCYSGNGGTIVEPSFSSIHSIVRDINMPLSHLQSATLPEMKQELNTDVFNLETTSPCTITSSSQITQHVSPPQRKNNDQPASKINKDDIMRENERPFYLQTIFILFVTALMTVVIAIIAARVFT